MKITLLLEKDFFGSFFFHTTGQCFTTENVTQLTLIKQDSRIINLSSSNLVKKESFLIHQYVLIIMFFFDQIHLKYMIHIKLCGAFPN